MQSKERLFRKFNLALLLGFLFIANACAPQPTAAIENSDTQTYVYVLCGDTNHNGGCESGDHYIPGVPATIFHKDGTHSTTFTDEKGSVSQFFPDETAVNIDLAAAEQQTGLCRTNLREITEGDTTTYHYTFTLCDTINS